MVVRKWKRYTGARRALFAVQRCSVENQKGAIAIDFVQR